VTNSVAKTWQKRGKNVTKMWQKRDKNVTNNVTKTGKFFSFGSRKRRKKGAGVDKKLQKKMKKLMNVVIMYEDQVRTNTSPRSRLTTNKNVFRAGMPDGLFSYQKSHFW
jgi:hypothetical protein